MLSLGAPHLVITSQMLVRARSGGPAPAPPLSTGALSPQSTIHSHQPPAELQPQPQPQQVSALWTRTLELKLNNNKTTMSARKKIRAGDGTNGSHRVGDVRVMCDRGCGRGGQRGAQRISSATSALSFSLSSSPHSSCASSLALVSHAPRLQSSYPPSCAQLRARSPKHTVQVARGEARRFRYDAHEPPPRATAVLPSASPHETSPALGAAAAALAALADRFALRFWNL